VVVHEGVAFAGFVAVAAGLLAWEVGTYGRSIAEAVGRNDDSRVTLVRTAALTAVLTVAVLVSYGVATLAETDLRPGGAQAGIAALLVLVGVLLVVGSLRQ
jgi:hypothetical protein